MRRTINAFTAVSVFTLTGCNAGVIPMPAVPMAHFVLDRQSLIEHLANPPAAQWSNGLITSVAVAEARAASPDLPKGFSIQALSTYADSASNGFAGSGANGRITSAPVHHFKTNEAHWLTDTGWLLTQSFGTGTARASNAFKAAYPSDTFPNSMLTVSNDGKRAYLCSLQGRFYAVDLATGNNLTGSPVNLGGTHAGMTAAQVAAPPFIDPFASKVNGSVETLYTVTHTGTLNRIVVSGGAIQKRQTYALPTDNTAPYTDLFRTAPMVLGGQAYIGVWRRHSSNPMLDRGALIHFDTGATGSTLADTASSSRIRVPLTAPVWAMPALEFDDDLNVKYAFVPTGSVVSMIELATGALAETPDLLVNQRTPVNGTLATYDYGTSTVSKKVFYPDTNGVVTLSSTTAQPLPDGSGVAPNTWKGTDYLYAARSLDEDSGSPVYGYLKFTLPSDTLTSGGVTRSIIDAEVTLRTTNLLRNSGAEMYRLKNDESWSATTITPTARPGFEDGAAFGLSTLASHAGYKLGGGPTPTTALWTNQAITWDATGLVTSGDRIYTFGLADPTLSYNYETCWWFFCFDGTMNRYHGTDSATYRPRLTLTLSEEGMSYPTLSTPVTIDALQRRIYAVNTNALYAASYANVANNTDYSTASFPERAASFGDPSKVYYSLTRQGQTTGAGPTVTSGGAKAYLANTCGPLFTGDSIYIMDHHPTSGRVSLNRFSTALPPVLAESMLLTNGSSDAEGTATHMSIDFSSGRVFLGTYDTAGGSSKGRTWVMTR